MLFIVFSVVFEMFQWFVVIFSCFFVIVLLGGVLFFNLPRCLVSKVATNMVLCHVFVMLSASSLLGESNHT